MRKEYLKKIFSAGNICLFLLIVLLGVMVYLNFFFHFPLQPDDVYPMTNSKIEWSGAGYSGVYGRQT